MKGKTHLALRIILITLIFILFFIYDKNQIILDFIFQIYQKETPYIILISLILFIFGGILPDIDSENNKSYIFHKPILKTIVKTVKLSIQVLWDIKHRGFFHSITGIFLTSLFITIIISIPYYLITKNFSIYVFFLWLISLFTGQLLHLIEDKIKNPFWKIRLT